MAKEAKSDDQLDQLDENLENQAAAPKKKSSRLLILLALISLVLFQVMALYFILPSPGKIAEELQKGGGTIEPPEAYRIPKDAIPQPDVNPADLVERPIGDPFRIQEPNPDSPGATDVFTVTVVLKIDKKEAQKFDAILAERPATIRGIVNAVLRGSTLQERKSETLGTIRNKIQIKVNEELGANYVKDVVCTDPSVLTM